MSVATSIKWSKGDGFLRICLNLLSKKKSC